MALKGSVELSCKRIVQVTIEETSCRRRFRAYLHPRGCMNARYTHLDIPSESVEGCLLGELARRGGYKLKVQVSGGGCFMLDPGLGLPGIRLCVQGASLHGGVAYLAMHKRGFIYLSIQYRRRQIYG